MVSIHRHTSSTGKKNRKMQKQICSLYYGQVTLLVVACLYGVAFWIWPHSSVDVSSLLLLTAASTDNSTTMASVDSNVALPSPISPISSTKNYNNNNNIVIPEYAKLPLDKTQHKLPSWMIEYFSWHASQRAAMTAQNWNTTNSQFQFLIMRCLHTDKICGGLSDRLQSLPFQLLMGYRHKRILLIYWERPFPLEEFLLPPQGGLDWLVPSYMLAALPRKDTALSNAPRTEKLLSSHLQNQQIVWIRDQTHNHGRSDYNALQQEVVSTSNNGTPPQHQLASFDEVFHDVWHMVLTPAPPVAQLIEKWMHQLDLIPGEYVSTHIRALYGVQNRSNDNIDTWTQHALDCTTQLRPQGPFFVASDSTRAQQTALEYGRQRKFKVVSRFHDTPPLHLDKSVTSSSSTILSPADYYDVFVDLYLLGNSRGLAYNVGGYGKLGLLLGFNASNGIQHQKGGVPWNKKGDMTKITLPQCSFQGIAVVTDGKHQPKDSQGTSSNGLSYFVPPMQ